MWELMSVSFKRRFSKLLIHTSEFLPLSNLSRTGSNFVLSFSLPNEELLSVYSLVFHS
jgi:hypothetical protein